jgi:hypothetical protein
MLQQPTVTIGEPIRSNCISKCNKRICNGAADGTSLPQDQTDYNQRISTYATYGPTYTVVATAANGND